MLCLLLLLLFAVVATASEAPAAALFADDIRARNKARQRVHAEAETAREALLSAELRSLRAVEDSPTIGHVMRSHVGPFLSAAGNEPAAGPILMGVATLLSAAATLPTDGCCWYLPRAAVLNGGDKFVVRVMALFAGLGLTSPLLEASPVADGEIALEVTSGTWTATELRVFARVFLRHVRRQPFGRSPAGRIAPSGRPFSPRVTTSGSLWVLMVLNAWRYLLV